MLLLYPENVTFEVGRNSFELLPRIVMLHRAYIMNARIHAGFTLQSKSRHFTRGSQFLVHKLWPFDHKLEQILKIILTQKNGHRITNFHASKLMIYGDHLCWEKNFIRNNAPLTFSFCRSVFLTIIDHYHVTFFHGTTICHIIYPLTAMSSLSLSSYHHCHYHYHHDHY